MKKIIYFLIGFSIPFLTFASSFSPSVISDADTVITLTTGSEDEVIYFIDAEFDPEDPHSGESCDMYYSNYPDPFIDTWGGTSCWTRYGLPHRFMTAFFAESEGPTVNWTGNRDEFAINYSVNFLSFGPDLTVGQSQNMVSAMISDADTGFTNTVGFPISDGVNWSGDNLVKPFAAAGLATFFHMAWWIAALIIISVIAFFAFRAFQLYLERRN